LNHAPEVDRLDPVCSHSQPRWPEPKTQPPATFPGALEDKDPQWVGGADEWRSLRRSYRVSFERKVIEGNLNKWDQADLCVDGALDPFNFDAKLNRGCAPHQISQPGISRP